MLMHLKHGYIRFGYAKHLNLLAVLGWVGLGPNFSTCGRLGQVGSVRWWVGLDLVTQNGPIDNSGVNWTIAIGNESAPKQLAQCWFPGMAISNDKI